MSRPPLACGLALIRRSPVGLASARTSSTGRAGGVEQLLAAGRTAATAPAAPGAPGCPLTPDSGTWCDRQVPVTWTPSTLSGPVQPFGVRRMISGQRGRGAVPVPAARRALDRPDLRPYASAQRRGEPVVHAGQVVALDLEHVVAVALEQRADLGRVLAAEHGRPGDLRAVEVQDRQHRAVAGRVEERDALPGALQRAGLGLAVADDRDREQVRVVHHRAERVHQHVAELAALVDRARRGDRDVAGDAAGRWRTAGTAAAGPPRPGTPPGRSRCRCPPGSRPRPAPDRRDRDRSGRSSPGRCAGSAATRARR